MKTLTANSPIIYPFFHKNQPKIFEKDNDKISIGNLILSERDITLEKSSDTRPPFLNSKDGRFVVSSSKNKKIQIWNTVTGELIQNKYTSIEDGAFSSNREHLIFTTSNGVINVINLNSTHHKFKTRFYCRKSFWGSKKC